MAKPIPDGFHTITPHLIVKGASDAIEFYRKAFQAEEIMRMPGPDGNLMYAEVQIGDSRLMLNDEMMEMQGPSSIGGTPVTITLYVDDCDAVFDRAVQSGAQAAMPMTDMFWGDRYGMVVDPFGHRWAIATHKQDLSAEEITKAAAAAFGGGGS